MIFEPNQGQANLNPADPHAQFIARGPGYSLVLGSEGATIGLQSKKAADSLQMKFAGANPNPTLAAADPLPGKSNYLIGNDRSQWRTNVPQFARVRYENVYPGINLVFYGNQGHLEYDFQVAPGADPSQTELEFDDATAIAQSDGSILIRRKAGTMRLQAPRVYQEISGREQAVAGRFVLRGKHRAGFAIGAYDHSRELVIDPILFFSTYFGGAGNEEATFVAIDAADNIYLTGSTTSTPPSQGGTFPVTTGVVQPALAGPQNAYIAKIAPSNPAVLIYATYIGGNGLDTPAGIAVDGAGDAFIAGSTTSTNFPVSSTAYQTSIETGSTGTSHVFATELAPSATTLGYSSYLSGNGTDLATGVAIDASADMYVTGTTTSTDNSSNNPTALFPAITLPYGIPFQSTSFGTIQFFVTKINTLNSGRASIAYSTYFGGGNTNGGVAPSDTGGGITVDSVGNIYFDGTTNYTYTNGELGDFPILNAYQPCLNQPPPTVPVNPPVCTNLATATYTDAFVAKINPNASEQGAQLQWSTYLGGIYTDSASGIAIDPGATNVFVVGTTNSPNISPQLGISSSPFQLCLNTPVNPTTSTCPADTNPTGPSDAFVGRLSNPASTSSSVDMTLNYFSYLGGTGNEAGLAIAVDPSDNAYLTGWTQSSGGTTTGFPVFPTPGSLQTALLGTQDAFIARLNTTTANGQSTSGAFSSYFGGGETAGGGDTAFTFGTGIALDQNENMYFAGYTNSINMEVNELQTSNAGGFDAFVTELTSASSLTVSGVPTLGTNQNYISAGNPATFTYTIANNGPDPAINVVFSDNITTGIGTNFVALTFVSATPSAGTCNGTGTSDIISCSIASIEPGTTVQVVVVLTPSSTGGTTSFAGGSVTVTAPGNTTTAQTSVSVPMSDFKLSVTPPNNSVAQAGDTAQYDVLLTPLPVYGSNVALSCSSLPTATTCNFTPTNTVTLPGESPGTAVLNVVTTQRPINTASNRNGLRNFYAVWLAVPGLALLGFGAGTNRRRRRILGFLMLCALFAQIILLPACSGQTTQPPVSGTPAGNYTIIVTAASGSDSKSAHIQLTVP